MAERVEMTEQSEYRSIFKATTLFGGVKIFQIIISIIRAKIVALLIGPTGIGLVGLFNSGTSLIQSATQLGLSQSAVRDISSSYASGNQTKINRTVTALRKLVWLTGLLGMVSVILLSPVLSKLSFGNNDYVLSFIFLSIILLFNQLSAGQGALLQGTRKLNYLAKSSVLGSALGLVICVPIYYYFGIKGIVPNLILASLTSMILSWYFARRVPYQRVRLSIKEVWEEGGQMMKMGVAMSASAIMVALIDYVLRSYINRVGGTEEVGLFSAGAAIMTTYVGLVFTAMGTDYFPRLSAVNKDNEKCKTIMNQQGEIGILILAPLLIACIVFVPIIVRILYSKEFLAVNPFIVWAAAGMLFKMASWAISFIFVAKGESKLFIINETSVNIYSLCFKLIGYKLWGIAGIGIGQALTFLFYSIQVYTISHKRYGFCFSSSFIRFFSLQLVFLAISVVFAGIFNGLWGRYVFGSVVLGVSTWVSAVALEHRIGLVSAIKARIGR